MDLSIPSSRPVHTHPTTLPGFVTHESEGWAVDDQKDATGQSNVMCGNMIGQLQQFRRSGVDLEVVCHCCLVYFLQWLHIYIHISHSDFL